MNEHFMCDWFMCEWFMHDRFMFVCDRFMHGQFRCDQFIVWEVCLHMIVLCLGSLHVVSHVVSLCVIG